MNKYINRRDGAVLLSVTSNTILKLDHAGKIPTPTVFLNTKTSQKKVAHYDRVAFENWAATNPIKHPGYKDAEKRKLNTKVRRIKVEDDGWMVRTKRGNFIYSGNIKNHILFCKNALLNRGHTFDVCNPV